jgi:hypothetical protein
MCVIKLNGETIKVNLPNPWYSTDKHRDVFDAISTEITNFLMTNVKIELFKQKFFD